MKIQKVISIDGREYIYIKEYNNFILYKDMITGCRTSFHKQELGLIEETEKIKEASKGGASVH